MTAAVAGSPADRAAGQPSTRPYLAPVPDADAPFDPIDPPPVPVAAAVRHPASGAPGAVPRGGLAFARSGPGRSAQGRSGAPSSVACDAIPSWSAEPDMGVRRTATAQLPDVTRAAQVFATALIEVMGGRRPVGQLRIHASPAVFGGLVNRTSRGPGTPIQLMSLRVCQPADGVAEVSATIRCGPRARAIAFRLEGVDGRWRVTALDIG